MKCNENRDFANKNYYCNNNQGVYRGDNKIAVNGMCYAFNSSKYLNKSL